MIKPILQDEVSECGLACIAMLINRKGTTISLSELRKLYKVSKDGLSLYQIINIFNDFNISSTPLGGDYKQIKDLSTPSILFWNKSHFVVLESCNEDGVTIIDPAMGRKLYPLEEVKVYFSGVALEIEESPVINYKYPDRLTESKKKFAPFELKSLLINNTWFYKNTILLIVLIIGVNLFSLAVPKLFSLTVDEVVTKNDEELVYLILYIFGLIFLLLTMFRFIRARLDLAIKEIVGNDVPSSVIRYISKLPLFFFESRTSASLLRKFQSLDILHIKFTSGLFDILGDSFFALVFLSLMVFINTKLAFISFSLCLIFIIFRLFTVFGLEKAQKDNIDREVERNAIFLSFIDEMKLNKLYGYSANVVSQWGAAQSKYIKTKAKVDYILDMNNVVFGGISNAQSLAISVFGSLAVLNGDNTLGDVFSFFLYKDLFLDSALRIIDKYMNLRIVDVEVNRLGDIFDFSPEVNSKRNSLAEGKLIENIELKDVSFRYGSFEEDVLKGVNISISKGEHISIIGKSGGGKSTLMNLMTSLYEVERGKLIVNGKSIQEFGLDNYRRRISFVTADNKVVTGSICDNVSMSDLMDLDKIKYFTKLVGLYDEIINLPCGFDTRVGYGGTALSSGQVQRLLLARALYREPDLLILDEPVSHLDDELKFSIYDLLRNQECAIISVTHDHEQCKYFDETYQIKDGELTRVVI
ncbi:peptidase domain-containing ABC transporter [Vibrio fluvialis]|nr:peptidase domain-containing ABC transporter [Vibrio fluvialis]